MVELGLNSHHQALVLSYMKFARYLRGQGINSIERTITDVENTLFDDTYTLEDVKSIFTKLRHLVHCDVEAEMCSFAHNNVLMLQQLFAQAESWHLRMEIQLSELQNSELLGMIQQLEVDETLVKPAVEKNSEGSSEALLRMEIERLRNEIERLNDQLNACAVKCESAEGELTDVKKKLSQAVDQLQECRASSSMQASAETGEFDAQVMEMETKLRQVEALLQVDQESSKERQNALLSELNTTKEQVATVQSQLKLAELELERKFSETKAYANMKQILMKKNGQIRRLRSRLEEFVTGSGDSSADGDDES